VTGVINVRTVIVTCSVTLLVGHGLVVMMFTVRHWVMLACGVTIINVRAVVVVCWAALLVGDGVVVMLFFVRRWVMLEWGVTVLLVPMLALLTMHP
jgi:hypothetical protein